MCVHAQVSFGLKSCFPKIDYWLFPYNPKQAFYKFVEYFSQINGYLIFILTSYKNKIK